MKKQNTHIKIITKSGDKYKLKWIEKKEGYVYSIINTRRIKIKKESLNTETPIYIPELINIEDKRDYIMGISMTMKETAIVLIAIDQIDKIKLISHSKTIGIPFTTAILSVLLVFIVDYTNPGTSVI